MKAVSWQSEMSTCQKFRNHRFLDESRRLLGGNAKKDTVKLIFCSFAETVWSAYHFLAAPSQPLQTKDSRRLSTQSLQTVSKTKENHVFFSLVHCLFALPDARSSDSTILFLNICLKNISQNFRLTAQKHTSHGSTGARFNEKEILCGAVELLEE